MGKGTQTAPTTLATHPSIKQTFISEIEQSVIAPRRQNAIRTQIREQRERKLERVVVLRGSDKTLIGPAVQRGHLEVAPREHCG